MEVTWFIVDSVTSEEKDVTQLKDSSYAYTLAGSTKSTNSVGIEEVSLVGRQIR